MKSTVLKRPMFKKNGGPVFDVENVGIMQGFKDGLTDEDEMEAAMGRMPDSPEILMNNLRGDMRSVDARVEELADLVGLDVAMGTPPEVLALLQPVLAGPQQPPMPPEGMPGQPPMDMGAGAMPPGPGMMPPPMPPPMPPEGMAPPMPPEMAGGIGGLMPPAAPPQAPIQMRDGGYVQRFSDGSDEEGVRPADSFVYPPEILEAARRSALDLIRQPAAPVPELGAEVERLMPFYRQVVGGGDRSMTQAQILFDIAQGGLNLAAGTDAEGRPLRGKQSAVSRFASAFSKVPGQIGARVAELDKEEKQLKLLALQAGEKNVAAIRDLNAKLTESKRKALNEVLKSSNASPFGKGDWHWSVVNRPGFLANYAAGRTTTEEDNLIESALAEFESQSRPLTEIRSDEFGNTYTAERPGKVIPDFVLSARAAREQLRGIGSSDPATTPQTGGGSKAASTTPQAVGQSTTVGGLKITPLLMPFSSVGGLPPKTPEIMAYSPDQPSMFNAARQGTGAFFSVPAAFIERVPIIKDFVDNQGQVESVTFLRAAQGQVNRVLQIGDRFTEGERKQVMKDLDLMPQLIDNPEAFQSRLIAVDSLLRQLRAKSYKDGFESPYLGKTDQARGRARVADIDFVRELMGIPPRISDFPNMEAFEELPIGSAFINSKGKIVYKDR
jgi:hypothetical protein